MNDCKWVFATRIAGKPAPQGSKRHVGGGRLVESSKAVGPWRTLVAWHVAQAWHGAPLSGPVYVRLAFVMPRPASAPKHALATKRPDVDKLARAVLDAVTGVLWVDDSQVVDMHARKRLAQSGEQPGLHLFVGIPEQISLSALTKPVTTLAGVVTPASGG